MVVGAADGVGAPEEEHVEGFETASVVVVVVVLAAPCLNSIQQWLPSDRETMGPEAGQHVRLCE